MEDTLNRAVFINCPFDPEYLPLMRACIFTVIACGYEPIVSLDFPNQSEGRWEKIRRAMEYAPISIHDLCRSKCKCEVTGMIKLEEHGFQFHHKEEHYRLNMPLELGYNLAISDLLEREGRPKKQIFVLENEPRDLLAAITDLRGLDPVPHHFQEELLLEAVRNFFVTNAYVPNLPEEILGNYQLFKAALSINLASKIRKAQGGLNNKELAPKVENRIAKLTTSELKSMMSKWLETSALP